MRARVREYEDLLDFMSIGFLVPQYTFWEGELDNIDLEDLLSLIQNIKTRVLRSPDDVNGMDALNIKHAINLANFEDYQLGL